MFEIELCSPRRVALIRFLGELSETHFATLEALAQARRGRDEYDAIFDFTKVAGTHIATDFVFKRGELHRSKRIHVVAPSDLKLLVRLYAAYQTSRGCHPSSSKQWTRPCAFACNAVDFRAIPLPDA